MEMLLSIVSGQVLGGYEYQSLELVTFACQACTMKDLLDSVGACSVCIHALYSFSAVTVVWLGFARPLIFHLGQPLQAVKAVRTCFFQKGCERCLLAGHGCH
jgi:hypothetical protein